MTWQAVFENPASTRVVAGNQYLVRVGKKLVRVIAWPVMTGRPPNMQRDPQGRWWTQRADTLAPLKKLRREEDFLPLEAS